MDDQAALQINTAKRFTLATFFIPFWVVRVRIGFGYARIGVGSRAWPSLDRIRQDPDRVWAYRRLEVVPGDRVWGFWIYGPRYR